jgi:hypothetical protein
MSSARETGIYLLVLSITSISFPLLLLLHLLGDSSVRVVHMRREMEIGSTRGSGNSEEGDDQWI